MELLISGFGLFVLAAAVANTLQVRYKFTYERNSILFICLYLFFLGGMAWYWQYLPDLFIVSVIIFLATFYCVTVSLLKKYWSSMQSLYGASTVPDAYYGLTHPRLRAQVVKVTEILLQDIAAWLIIAGLVVFLMPVLTYLTFTIIVLIMHLPAPRLFGKVFGAYFLVVSVGLSAIVPFLFSLGETGFLLLYSLHLSGYVAMYVLFGTWGKVIHK